MIPTQPDIEYPESDGRPIAESSLHREVICDMIAGLEHYYRDQPDVYVSGTLLLYYVEGDPSSMVCPDVFVVFGVPKGDRNTYKLWEEGRAPSFVIEVTSLETREEDLVHKKRCYEQLGVEEYFLHDPWQEYLVPPLQGYRLIDGEYHRIVPARDGSLISLVTGLALRPEGERLRLFTTIEKPLLRIDELWERVDTLEASLEAESRAVAQEAQARREAEARAAQAEARLAQEAQARREIEEGLAHLRRELANRNPAG